MSGDLSHCIWITCLLEAPGPTPWEAAGEEPDDDQQQHGADGRHDDGRQHAARQMNPQTRHQPAADQSAYDADGHVANQAEAAALDNLAGEPAGNDADDQNDQKPLSSDVPGANPFAASYDRHIEGIP